MATYIIQRLFSKKKEEDNKKDGSKKLSPVDRETLWEFKHITGPKGRQMYREINKIGRIKSEEDKELAKRGLKKVAAAAGTVAATAPVIGAGIGALVGGKTGAKCGARGGAVGGAIFGIGEASGIMLKKALLKNKKYGDKYEKAWEKQEDMLDVADGKMSREDFIEKWGKERKDK